MTDEEKKAIDDLFSLTHINGYINLYDQKKANIYTSDLKRWQNGVKVLLNLLQTQREEIEKKNKRISNLEFALMDMVLQFADESKNSINTMGLSALEIAFNELDFDNPMSIKEVHERYKKLAQKYYK